MRTALLFTAKNGSEVRISLHPISLLMLLAESLEDAGNAICRRRGHGPEVDGHCERCGRNLPDTGSPYGAWLAEVYRSVKAR